MKFSIVINKWANFYFFVQNLSEWHFSCRKIYNADWRKELGPFSADEENALKRFREIRAKYKQGKTHLEQAFFLTENPLEELKTNLREYDAMREIFNLFEDKFNKIYEKDLPSMIKWREALDNKINDPTLIKSITETLSALYDTPPLVKEIKIYLLLSTSNQRGGGANIDERSVSIELSRQPLNQITAIMGIIWHEVIHLCFEKKYFLQLLNKKFPNDLAALRLIREAAASALFPNGALARKFFLQKEEKILHPKLPAEYTKSILELGEYYIQKNKPFDDKYTNKLFLIISNLKDFSK